jgi:hypothetical protein
MESWGSQQVQKRGKPFALENASSTRLENSYPTLAFCHFTCCVTYSSGDALSMYDRHFNFNDHTPYYSYKGTLTYYPYISKFALIYWWCVFQNKNVHY